MALAGVPVILDAKRNIDAYDADIMTACSVPVGCSADMIPSTALAARDRSHRESMIAVSLFTVGAAMLAGGTTMLILNQPRVVADEPPVRATVAPIVGRGSFGLSFAFVH
jgi:hypothetical protein